MYPFQVHKTQLAYSVALNVVPEQDIVTESVCIHTTDVSNTLVLSIFSATEVANTIAIVWLGTCLSFRPPSWSQC